MNADDTVVIVGASLAGAKTAEALRAQGFEGHVVLIGSETHIPYMRPLLSKKYLTGELSFEDGFVQPPEWYSDHDIDLRRETTVTAIDPAAHTVELNDGSSISYTKLVLATGSRPTALTVDGADAAGVLYLRTVEDSDALKEAFAAAGRVAVIGAGWIGLEVAAAARTAGVDVAVVEMGDLPLKKILGPEMAAVFAEMHREHGVDFYFNRSVAQILTEDGHVIGVRLDDDTEIATSIVVGAVGVSPAVELAVTAGLEMDNGVVVDASLRTSDPDIYAVGDIANADNPAIGHRARVEHFAIARDQPAIAAAALLGTDAVYADLPFFFTNQYDVRMENVGLAGDGNYDSVVVRGDQAGREFRAFWLKDGAVLASMKVNYGDDNDAAKALISSGRVADPVKLADPDVPLDQVFV